MLAGRGGCRGLATNGHTQLRVTTKQAVAPWSDCHNADVRILRLRNAHAPTHDRRLHAVAGVFPTGGFTRGALWRTLSDHPAGLDHRVLCGMDWRATACLDTPLGTGRRPGAFQCA